MNQILNIYLMMINNNSLLKINLESFEVICIDYSFFYENNLKFLITNLLN